MNLQRAFHWIQAGCLLVVAVAAACCDPALAADDSPWVTLFNGQDLTGWKASEDPASFVVRDGMIVAQARGAVIKGQAGHPKCHLFYVGPDGQASFRNFEFTADVKTEPESNGGIYFHARYLENNWPQVGCEVQINSLATEKRKTGGLYAIQDITESPVKNNEWFTLQIVVRDQRVVVKVNGMTTVDWTQPADFQSPKNPTWSDRRLGSGTFALQAHDAKSVVYYKNIRVRPLPDARQASETTAEKGPLRVHPANPRYFTDGSGRAVYLTGSHTWANLQDFGPGDPPPVFDYDAYLDFLERHHHNFFRLWRWELATWPFDDPLELKSGVPARRYSAPHPWKRTGPGKALDGKPKFDLDQLDPAYFERLRSRVAAADRRGMYVSIMLFEGFVHCCRPASFWDGHPMHVQNHVQGINADLDQDGKGREVHTLTVPAITRIQEAYVRKVVDTVNDLDNVLYEIANESYFEYSKDWQYHMIRYVKEYEEGKPKQHPVGMTGYTKSDNRLMFDSPADWISPGSAGHTGDPSPFKSDPPVTDGGKVVILDTDHIWGLGGGRDWVWKSFTRGYHPIWMDSYPKMVEWWVLSVDVDNARRNLGHARRYAERMNLAAMAPRGELASTGFCLANPGREYLVFLPEGGEVSVDLSAAKTVLTVEWFNPLTGTTAEGGGVEGGARRSLRTPFDGDAVLYLKAK